MTCRFGRSTDVHHHRHPAALADLTGSWTIDPTHSRVGFVARHAMVTKVRGAFNDFEGRAVVDGADLSGSRVNLFIQAASIDTRNEQRDEHLRSNDFFDMEHTRKSPSRRPR